MFSSIGLAEVDHTVADGVILRVGDGFAYLTGDQIIALNIAWGVEQEHQRLREVASSPTPSAVKLEVVR